MQDVAPPHDRVGLWPIPGEADGWTTDMNDGRPTSAGAGNQNGVAEAADSSHKWHRADVDAPLDASVAEQLLAATTDCVAVLHLDGTIKWLNHAGRVLLNSGHDHDMSGQGWGDLWQPGSRELVEAAILNARSGVGTRFSAFGAVSLDAPKFWDVIVTPVKGRDGSTSQILTVARDISLQKSFEDRVRASEEHFRALADNIAQFAWMADRTGHIFWYNKRWFDYTGTNLEEMAGWGWQKVHHPAHVERVVEKISRHFASGEPWEDTFPLRGVDGSYRWFLSRAMPIKDARGQVRLWCGTNTDITEQMEFSDRLRQKARLIALSHEAILAWDFNGGIVSWNKGCEELYGYSFDEAVGKRTHDLLHTRHPMSVEEFEQFLVKERAWSGEIQHRAKDGSEIWVESRQELIDIGRGSIVLETNRDITERRKAEELRRLLLSELDHRVKNTLAIVQAIASQTARRAADLPSFASSFNARLQALASAHNLLTSTSWSGADLHNIVHAQLVDGSGLNQQITIEGEPVFLPAQVALQTSLILYELASNARKYGALSRIDGRVAISWRRFEDSPDKVHLTWKEIGGPPVSQPISRGYGMTLIERAGGQPSLTARLAFEADGVRCDIHADIANECSEHQTYFSPTDSRLRPPSPRNTVVRPDRRNLKRILIIEDEPLIALEIEEMLEALGYSAVGQAASVEEALSAIDRTAPNIAVVDANLNGESVDTILATLQARKIAFIIVTGFSRDSLPPIVETSRIPVVTKPVRAVALFEALTSVTRG